MNTLQHTAIIIIAGCSLAGAASAATADTQQRITRQRLQLDVARNVAQQRRIQQGIDSGALTRRETARLEYGQARVNRIEASAPADGRVGAVEQARIQSVENRQSRQIFRTKHNLRHD